VSASKYHTCALDIGGRAWCWGADGTTGFDVRSPTQMESSDWATVAAGSRDTCAIKEDGSLWCWGSNEQGELGDGSWAHHQRPWQVPGQGWASASMAVGSTLAIVNDGSIWLTGTSPFPDAPPPPRLPGTWMQGSAGARHSCALQLDRSLWCWGWRPGGEPDTIDSAVQMPGTRWASVAVGTVGVYDQQDTTCGIEDDRSLTCWRWGDVPGGSSSVVIEGAWASVRPRSGHICGLRTDHTLWCWGSSSHGQLGSGNIGDAAATPRAVPGEWLEIDVADHGLHTCAITIAGALWCWGDNSHGQLGDALRADTPDAAPRQLPGRWRHVATGQAHTCAVRDDHTLWCWGSNDHGQLGIGGAWLDEPHEIRL
jgi:alpha-tubulin suppressor-like RCC1 family protein